MRRTKCVVSIVGKQVLVSKRRSTGLIEKSQGQFLDAHLPLEMQQRPRPATDTATSLGSAACESSSPHLGTFMHSSNLSLRILRGRGQPNCSTDSPHKRTCRCMALDIECCIRFVYHARHGCAADERTPYYICLSKSHCNGTCIASS